MLKAILFDMDGVLVDSVPINFMAFNKVLEEYNVQIPKKDIKKFAGTSLKYKIPMWEEAYSCKIPIDYIEFGSRSQKYQHEWFDNNLKPNDSITNFINSAKNEGIKIILVTANRLENAKKILSLLNLYDKFDSIITRENVENHKPYPDCYLLGAKNTETIPSECIVFEDAINGISAAKNAKMKVIGRVTEVFTKEELIEGGADFTFNDFSEINLDIVKKVLEK